MLTMRSTPTDADTKAARRGVAARLSLMQAANFAGIGLYLPFFPVWLSARGLSDSQIGLTLALGMVVRMLATQPLAALGDRGPGAVATLAVMQGACAVAYLLLLILPAPFGVMAGSVLVALLSAAVIPLGDYLVAAQVRRDGRLDYARIRLWGSVAFLVVSVGAGWLLGVGGPDLIVLGLAACCVLAAGVALLAPRPGYRTEAHDPTAEPRVAASGDARLLWLLITASALVNASHAALYAFGTLHWRVLGIGDGMIGALWAAGVVAEIITFWALGPMIARTLRAAMTALCVAAVVAALRFALMPLAEGWPAILALQLTHALSFGAQHMAVVAIASALAPPGRRALVQGRVSAVNACLMGAATLGAGHVYQAFDSAVFLAMVPLALAALVITLLSMRRAGEAPSLDSPTGGGLPDGAMAEHRRAVDSR